MRIIEARYGVEGGNDRDVLDEFLSPRLKGDALVGWVGSDLFGPLDPAIGQPKRLRVKYSFDGVERLIVRKENEMLVLPEDVAALKRLERELEAIHNDAVNRLAKGYERDLETAQRSSQQCERERRELIEIFPILEVQALKLAREMHLFLRNEFEKPMEVTPEMPQNRRLDVMVANYDWRVRLADAFEHRFAAKVKQLYSQFGEIGIRPQKVPESFSEHISTLISLAHEHGRECLLKSES